MSGFLNKLFGHQQPPQSTDEDTDLEKFYTDSEHARQVFEEMVTSKDFPKRMLVIHGLGGVGKSTLLKMYALSCRKHHIPAALVASEETPSPVDVLADWEIDLNHDGLTLPTFHKTLTHYRAIEAKVNDEENKGYQVKSQIAGTLGKTAAKTAISMAASVIPIVGPLVGVVGSENAAGEPPFLRIRVPPSWEWAWDGRYAERVKELRVSLEVARSLQDLELLCVKTRNLGLCLASQGKCVEAEAAIEESLTLARTMDRIGEWEMFVALAIYGIACLKCGKLDRAEEYLTQAISVAQKLKGHVDAAPVYIATVYEVLKAFDKAEHFYRFSYEEAHPLGRHYFECSALTGLVRVKDAQNDHAAIPPLWTEAEQLAQKYEYNDYFTSLYLTRGHVTWDGLIPEWENGFDSALHYYQLAVIHALRFNRFLLDEALSGREQGTPLRPIIPHCLERGMEGQRMLGALRDWWQSGINDTGAPRPDTISPIPESISLLEAERIARDREPGDGSAQVSVVEQISRALAGTEGQ